MKKTPLPRITWRWINRQILDAFNLERGLFFTIYYLTVRPGRVIREFLFTDRSKLVPPLRLLIFSAAIATFLTVTFFDFTEGFSQGIELGLQGDAGQTDVAPERLQRMEKLGQRLEEGFRNYYNVLLLLGVPVIALCTFLILRKDLFFTEHLVINAYITSWQTLGYILLAPLFIIDYPMASNVYLLISLVYAIFAYYQVFRLQVWESIWKGVIANLLYFTLYIPLISLMLLVFFLVNQ